MPKVKLSDVIQGIQFNSDFACSYLNSQTGEIILLTDEDMKAVENDEMLDSDWQKEGFENAKEFLENPDLYIELPNQRDVNEYRIMEEFTFNIEDEVKKETLLIALDGPGAFRRFKDMVKVFDLEEKWYRFLEERYEVFAMSWCEDNNIEVILEKAV